MRKRTRAKERQRNNANKRRVDELHCRKEDYFEADLGQIGNWKGELRVC